MKCSETITKILGSSKQINISQRMQLKALTMIGKPGKKKEREL